MLRAVLATAYYLLAVRNIRRGWYDAAGDQLSKAISYVPDYAAAYCNRALVHHTRGDHKSAVLDCDRAIELAPNMAMAFHNRGISEKILEDLDAAIADQSRAIALDPGFADAHSELGVAYACKHEHDLAIACLTKALKLNEANAGHYLRHRGFSRFHRGDFNEAATDLRQSLGLERDPYAALMYYLARTRAGGAAISELEADARSFDTGGWPYPLIEVFLGAGTPDAALAAAPSSEARAEAHFHIGEWHLLRGDRADAVEALKQAASTCPANFLEYAGAIAELRRLAV
jgi:tetratricopeptide (TPR) repeat protein